MNNKLISYCGFNVNGSKFENRKQMNNITEMKNRKKYLTPLTSVHKRSKTLQSTGTNR